jgi:hypothetical protein
MKKLVTIVVAVCVFGVLATAFVFDVFAAARPSYAIITTYFDANGNEVGWTLVNCNLQRSTSGDTSGDIYTVEFVDCGYNNLQPITCSDAGVGSTSVGSCSNWCVSDGYALSYELNLVPDCYGNYKSPTPTPTPTPSPSLSP